MDGFGFERVCQEPDLPDGWHYNFDDTAVAPTMKQLSVRVKMEKIIEVMAKRAQKKENPEDSPYDPSNSPFGLLRTSSHKLIVVTKDGKEVSNFSKRAYGFNIPADINIALDCHSTYEIMCRAHLPSLFKKLKHLKKQSTLLHGLLDHKNGPIMMNVSEAKDEVLIHTALGMVARVSLVVEAPSADKPQTNNKSDSAQEGGSKGGQDAKQRSWSGLREVKAVESSLERMRSDKCHLMAK